MPTPILSNKKWFDLALAAQVPEPNATLTTHTRRQAKSENSAVEGLR